MRLQAAEIDHLTLMRPEVRLPYEACSTGDFLAPSQLAVCQQILGTV